MVRYSLINKSMFLIKNIGFFQKLLLYIPAALYFIFPNVFISGDFYFIMPHLFPRSFYFYLFYSNEWAVVISH